MSISRPTRFAVLGAPLILVAGALAAPRSPAGHLLASEHKAGTAIEVRMESSSTMELVASRIERDGEVTEAPTTGTGSSDSWNATWTDQLETVEENRPTALLRTFGAVAGSRGGRDGAVDMESPFDEAVVRLAVEGEEVTATAVEGSDLPQERLDSLTVLNPLEGLLPGTELDVDATFEVRGEALEEALGLGLSRTLFAPPARAEAEGGEGRRRRDGRGMRWSAEMFAGLEWDLEGKLVAVEEGVARIAIEGEGNASRTNQMGGGESNTEIAAEVKGELLFHLAERRVVSFEAKLEAQVEQSSTFSRGESSGSMETSLASTLEVSVGVARTAAAD